MLPIFKHLGIIGRKMYVVWISWWHRWLSIHVFGAIWNRKACLFATNYYQCFTGFHFGCNIFYLDSASNWLHLNINRGGSIWSLHTHLSDMPMEWSHIRVAWESSHQANNLGREKISIQWFLWRALQPLYNELANSLGSWS